MLLCYTEVAGTSASPSSTSDLPFVSYSVLFDSDYSATLKLIGMNDQCFQPYSGFNIISTN